MRRIVLLSTALLAPLAAATAQAPDGGRPDAARFEQRMAQHRAERAQDMATVLALKPAQKPALDAWLAALTPAPHDWHKGPPAAEPTAPRTTPEMLQHKQQDLAERQQRETALIEATKHFYAALDTQQQRVFDALERLRHGHDGHGFGGHRGPGGPGGDMPPPPMHGE